MKATIKKNDLISGIRQVLNIVTSRTTLPILNNVLIECEDESMTFTTTDLEICIKCKKPAVTVEPGSVTIPAKKFAQITGTLSDKDVTLESDKGQVTSISCGKSLFKIVGLDAKEFPRESDFPEEWSISLPADMFRKSLAKVSYARSTDETRHILNGILLSIRDGVMTIASTDGRRLALTEKSLPEDESFEDGDVILPPKVVSELQKNVPSSGEVTTRLSESRAAFDFPEMLITTKLVKGTYPNYRQVIPPNFSRSVSIPREQFAEVVNRVSMMVSETSSSIKMALDKAKLVISAVSSEFGEAEEPMAVSYEGEALEIAFNPIFLNDPLPHLECDQLIMQFNDEYSPVSLTGDEGFLYILMPMRGRDSD